MKLFIKLGCPYCCGKYYVDLYDMKCELPLEIRPGEAFPFICPLCNTSNFSILVDLRKERTIYRSRL